MEALKLLALALAAGVAQAEVYRYHDASGALHYGSTLADAPFYRREPELDDYDPAQDYDRLRDRARRDARRLDEFNLGDDDGDDFPEQDH